jgi:hypothetical protein
MGILKMTKIETGNRHIKFPVPYWCENATINPLKEEMKKTFTKLV